MDVECGRNGITRQMMEGSENESAQKLDLCYNQSLKIYDGEGVLQMKTDDAGVILVGTKRTYLDCSCRNKRRI